MARKIKRTPAEFGSDEVADLRRANADLQRKLNEAVAGRDEGEAQKAAIAEILEVINCSAGDLAPVFNAILEKAHALCGAALGTLVIGDGEQFRIVAVHAEPPVAESWRRLPHTRPAEGTPIARLMGGERIVHLTDVLAEDAYRNDPPRRRVHELAGVRTSLLVPLRKDGTLLGALAAYRQEVRPFSDKQIALLENFAGQAVIAMENARLITETREALEQQTATAEVLKAISRSTFDLRAVLQTVVSAAHRLCQSDYSVVFRQEGEEYRWAAGYGSLPNTKSASAGSDPAGNRDGDRPRGARRSCRPDCRR
jgi:GAF domain-containing protein